MRLCFTTLGLIGLVACSAAGSGAARIATDTPLVVADADFASTYGEVVSGQLAIDIAQPPVEIEQVRSSASCPTLKPRGKAKVAYVYTYGGGDHVPLQHVNFIDTPEAAAKRREQIREFKKTGAADSAIGREAASFTAGNAVEWSSRVDILVTETEAPVFLYLSSYDSVLWNIQTAPGAEIDGIIVNSYAAGAIANGVEPSRTAFISFDNSPNRKCYLAGAGRAIPPDERIASARKLNPDFNPRDYEQKWKDDYREARRVFDSELPRRIGKRPTWILNDARGADFKAVLVGPSSGRIEIQPVSRLQAPSHVTSFWGRRDEAFKVFGLDEAI